MTFISNTLRREEAGFSMSELLVGISITAIITTSCVSIIHAASKSTNASLTKETQISIGENVRKWQHANPELDALQEGVLSAEEGFSPRAGYSYSIERYKASTGEFCLEVTRDGYADEALLYNSDKRTTWEDCSFISDLGNNELPADDQFTPFILDAVQASN